MPRQSRVDKVLADREAELEQEVAQAATAAEQKANELKSVRDLRKRLAAAAPKRQSRAKRLVPANTQPATATAA